MWKSKNVLISGASDFHNLIREILCSDKRFSSMACFQEVPVKDLCEDYRGNHFLDWFIRPLGVCLELHGTQHYKATAFGDEGIDTKLSNFQKLKIRDIDKKYALESEGYKYIAIPYSAKKELQVRKGDLLYEIIY